MYNKKSTEVLKIYYPDFLAKMSLNMKSLGRAVLKQTQIWGDWR
jgi:hypothetical protein